MTTFRIWNYYRKWSKCSIFQIVFNKTR